MSDTKEFERASEAFGSGNYALAKELFGQLESNEYPRANLYLGWMCAQGLGGPENLKEAEYHYRRLADTGDPDGKYFLAATLHARRDYHSAVSLYQEAADAGNASAAFWTYSLYRNDLPQEVDSEKKAQEYLLKAARLGHIFAKRDLLIQEFTHGQTFARRLLARVQCWGVVFKGFILAIRNVEDPRVR